MMKIILGHTILMAVFLVSTAAQATRPPIDFEESPYISDSELILRVLAATDNYYRGYSSASPSIVFLADEDFSLSFKKHLDELVANYQYHAGGTSMDRIDGTEYYNGTIQALFRKVSWYSGKVTDPKEITFSGTIPLTEDKQAENKKDIEKILHYAFSMDVKWYSRNNTLYIKRKGEREWLTEKLVSLQDKTEKYRKLMADTLASKTSFIQRALEEMKTVVEAPVPSGISPEDFALRYVTVEERATQVSHDLTGFAEGKSLSTVLIEIKNNERLIVEIRARLAEERGMRLTE